ncbi:ABC transporter ATP-binding protein [Solimonas variicoloris]|uniref:ABC transporter ATP-binding protein n=1 Tax=Solimonas variicoloris TaxID=254408 RepID=UPI00037C6A32|nr:ABC transporter ATP-binding protein [Solimonas variicoloris]
MSERDLSSAPAHAAGTPMPMHGPRMGPPGLGTIVRARDPGGTLRRLARRVGAQWPTAAVVLACTVGSVLLGSLVPWQLGRATDLVVAAVRATRPVDFTGLVRGLVVAAALQGLAVLLHAAQAWLSAALVQDLSRTLRRQAEEKLGRLPLVWFDRQPHGEVLSRISNDIDNVSQSLQQLLSQLLMSILQLLAVLAMMLWLSPLLAAIALLGLLASLLVSRVLAQRSRPHFVDQWRWTGVLNGNVEENYTGQTLMKVFGHQRRARERFEADNVGLRDSAFDAQFVSGAIQPAMMFVGQLGFIGVVAGGALRVLAGAMTIGALQSFVQYIRQINQPIGQIAGAASVLQSASASAERVFELLDAPELAPDPEAPADVAAPRGHVVFEHVTFRYDPTRPLFEDVSLEALPGQTVAIVGPTGAGKTTLVNLLMRFYEIGGGAIRLDGVDTRRFAREALRRHFGMVLQDTWLFSGTIRDNIAYGKDGATEDEIVAAARACHVDDFVRTLPRGYDTPIDENGGGLSTGQKQLLTITRAFIARPAVLILDEATSSVDTRTELLVQRAMAKLRAGRTSFVIAHRLSTIRDADTIVYMENGNVLERGSHIELMAQQGRYWQLYQSQFAGAAPEHAAA